MNNCFNMGLQRYKKKGNGEVALFGMELKKIIFS